MSDYVVNIVAAAVLLLACSGCGWNAREVQCVATVELNEDVQIAECDHLHGGKCPDDELDKIMDPNDEKAEECVKKN